jgi:hypothetical protein
LFTLAAFPETLPDSLAASNRQQAHSDENEDADENPTSYLQMFLDALTRPFREAMILNRDLVIRLGADGSFFSAMVFLRQRLEETALKRPWQRRQAPLPVPTQRPLLCSLHLLLSFNFLRVFSSCVLSAHYEDSSFSSLVERSVQLTTCILQLTTW